MANNDQQVKLIIEAFDKFSPAFREFNKQLADMKTGTEKSQKGLIDMFNSISAKTAGAVAAFAGVAAAAKSIVTETAAAGTQLAKLSQNTGISVENLAKFKKAAELGESNLEEFVGAVTKMQANLGKADADLGSFGDALNAIGLNAKALQGLPVEDQVLKIADAFAKFQDGTNKVAAAREIFGRNGAQMIATLNELRENFEEVDTLWSDGTAAAAKEYEDNVKRMEQRSQAFKAMIGNEVIPTLNEFLEMMLGKREAMDFTWLDDLNRKFGTLTKSIIAAVAVIPGLQGLSMQAMEVLKGWEENGRDGAPFGDPQHHEEVKPKVAPIKDRGKGAKSAIEANKLELQERRNFLKESESIAAEMMNTLQKVNDLGYEQLKMTEQEYYDNKKKLEVDALEQAIAYSEEEKNSILAAWEKRKVMHREQADRDKDHREVLAETGRIEAEIAKKREQIDQKNIEGQIKNIQLTRELAQAKRDGELKVLEAEIALQSKLYSIKVQRGEISSTQAAISGKQGEIDVLQKRISNIQDNLSSGVFKGKEIESANSEIESLHINLQGLNEELSELQLQNSGSVWDGMARGFRQVGMEMENSFKNGLDAAQSMSSSMMSAFDDFFNNTSDNFMKFGKLAEQVLNSIYREIIKMLILKPLMNSITSGLGSLFGSGGGEMVAGLANGGVMTSSGLLPLRTYSSGGVAYRPQLAMFGEGSKPEAFVPLPDGRRIPVSMQGAAGGGDTKVDKEYLVRVKGEINEQKLRLLNHGLSLDGRPLKPARVSSLHPNELQFILWEGRKRQIRRMCALVGLEVVRLKRVRIGRVTLGRLPYGKWRFLAEGELF